MPTGMQSLDMNFPSFSENMNSDEKISEVLSYLYSLLESLKYALSNLGAENFNETELNNITSPIMGQIKDVEDNLMTIKVTADSAKLTASNALGKAQSVELTVDGLSVANETGSYTIIDGDKLTSFDSETLSWVVIADGKVVLATQGGMIVGGLYFDANESKIILNSDWGMPLKIVSAANLNIDAAIGSKVEIGTSASASGNVDIGKTGGTVNLIGTILNNGKTLGAAVFT